MKLCDIDYALPQHLIAHDPTPQRGDSRLLLLNRRTGALKDSSIADLCETLTSNDVLVFNDTKVMKARLLGI